MKYKLTILTLVVLCVVAGCSSPKQVRTGFLSDYSQLEQISENNYLYLSPDLGKGYYTKFIVDPIIPYFHAETKASKEVQSGKITYEELDELMDYARSAIVDAIDDAYPVVYKPGPGVVRVRIALTNLMRSKIGQNMLPQTKLAGTGLGGASMEGEMLDSLTGRQLAAVVQTQKGTRWTMSNMTTWGDAKNVINDWAKIFRKRLDELNAGN